MFGCFREFQSISCTDSLVRKNFLSMVSIIENFIFMRIDFLKIILEIVFMFMH